MIKKSIMTLAIATVATALMGGVASAAGLKLEHLDNRQIVTPAHYSETCIYFDKKYLACLDLRIH